MTRRSMHVGEIEERDGFTFADVRDDSGNFVGRIVESGSTWAPDAGMLKYTNARWESYEAAKAALEVEA